MAEKTRANPDYSASMINPTNSEVVIKDWQYLNSLNNQMKALQESIELSVPTDLRVRRDELAEMIDKAQRLIRQDIDDWGSYQNIELGQYALKQERERIIFKPELVKQFAPAKVASFVLVESVDQKAMEAMLRTKQIDPPTARKCGEIERTYAYIVK